MMANPVPADRSTRSASSRMRGLMAIEWRISIDRLDKANFMGAMSVLEYFNLDPGARKVPLRTRRLRTADSG